MKNRFVRFNRIKKLYLEISWCLWEDNVQFPKLVLQAWAPLARIKMIWKQSVRKSSTDVSSNEPWPVTQCHAHSTTPSQSQAIMKNTVKKEVELVFRADISMNLAQWSRQLYRMGFVGWNNHMFPPRRRSRQVFGWTFSFPWHNVHVSKPLKKLWEGSDLKSLNLGIKIKNVIKK